MLELKPQEVRALFRRLIFETSLVWGATILVAAMAAKASDDFIWVMYVLLAGFGLSCAVIEAARRRFFRM